MRSIVETEGRGRTGRYRRRLFGNLGEITATLPECVRRGNADHAREVLRGSDRLIFVLDWRSFPPNYRDPRSRDYERTRDLGVLELIDRPRTGSPSLSARHESKATLPATRTGFRPDYLPPIRSLYTRKIRVVGRF